MEDFQCPINQTLMEDPVVAPDGWSYERTAIEEWIRMHGVSPMTREPLALSQLVPNISLRNAIAQFKKDHPEMEEAVVTSAASIAPIAPTAAAAPITHVPAAPAVAASLPAQSPALEADTFQHQDDTYLRVSMQLQTRSPAERKPAFIVALVDISGSMNESVNHDNPEESMFSRLDLVKHTLSTFITCLGADDYLSIITYDNVAAVDIPPTLLTEVNKQRARQTIQRLQPRGGTNIWGALSCAMDVIKAADIDKERYNVGCFLLTDGQANINPPRGILPTLQQKLTDSPICFAINTFAYGYSLDSALLVEIANMTNGAYGFIPDASMVGTVFVNALANLLSAGATQTEVSCHALEDTGYEVLAYKTSGPMQTLKNGSLSFGGRRSYLIKLPSVFDRTRALRITAKMDGLTLTHECSIADCPPMAPEVFYSEFARVRMMEVVRSATQTAAAGNNAAARDELCQLQAILQHSEGHEYEHVQAIIRDLDSPLDSEGQLSKALGNQAWYQRWGCHYVPHFMNAHDLQHCLNFKDHSLQQFGGNLFQQIQKTFEEAFISLPAPQPSLRVRAGVAVPTTMANYYNYGGGCFLGHGRVERLDEQTKSVQSVLVQDIRRGDRVRTSMAEQHCYASVRCVVRMQTEEPMQFVDVNGLVITHWHPIMHAGRWTFPANLPDKYHRVSGFPSELAPKTTVDASDGSKGFVYDFVLDGMHQHSVVINGTEAITLGHGLDDPVAAHAYLGTQAVIDDLSKLPGWQDGLVTLHPSQYIRNESNQISGIVSL